MLDLRRLGRRSELRPHDKTRGREKLSPLISSSSLMACERNGVRTKGKPCRRSSGVASIMWPIWTTVVQREAWPLEHDCPAHRR
uniref:Uncharacterized protein n=1 Tax=Cannabis sativa TaxID=3483 RepID=A0A803PUQ0_CANSA